MGSTVRIGTAQPKMRLIDYRIQDAAQVLKQVECHLTALEKIVQRAGKADCDVIALPEDTLGLGRWKAANRQALGEILPTAVDRMIARLGQAASSHNMYLVCCNDTFESDGALYNTAFFLGRDGKEIGRYHKVNMPLSELASKKRGSDFPVFETPDLGDVGMLICYDMVFPEAARCLALGGADMIFHLTLGGAAMGDGDISRAAFRTRAVENFVYVIVSHRGSGSMVISPAGDILAEGKGGDDVAIADLDPFGGRQSGDAFDTQEDMRARLFRERSPAAYGILTVTDPPVLAKLPETVTPAEAARVAQGALTIGEDRFTEAEELLREGKTDEAIHAFETLRAEYPRTWIDRVSLERLAQLRG